MEKVWVTVNACCICCSRLSEIYLWVLKDNKRAIALSSKMGFTDGQENTWNSWKPVKELLDVLKYFKERIYQSLESLSINQVKNKEIEWTSKWRRSRMKILVINGHPDKESYCQAIFLKPLSKLLTQITTSLGDQSQWGRTLSCPSLWLSKAMRKIPLSFVLKNGSNGQDHFIFVILSGGVGYAKALWKDGLIWFTMYLVIYLANDQGSFI